MSEAFVLILVETRIDEEMRLGRQKPCKERQVTIVFQLSGAYFA